jgi:nicotinate-nucleotide pyrophosphorylase (carboxylating)
VDAELIKPETIRLIQIALQEDVRTGDITSEAIFPARGAMSGAQFIARQDGIVCGLEIGRLIFSMLSGESAEWESLAQDGQFVAAGTPIARVRAEARDLLAGERTALNFMQRMSGVASQTRRYVQAIEGYATRILDTRKTIPAWRSLDKYAVRMGGGYNHRYGLYDMALIKDNHIAAAGSISNAIERCRQNIPADTPLEVEADTLEQVKEILSCIGVQRIMFDNFTPGQTQQAVELVNGRCQTESSGGITLQTIASYAAAGVDFISVGALTHSAIALDISMDIELYG